jgi:hypothetical protein
MNQKYITSYYTKLKKRNEFISGMIFLLSFCFGFLIAVGIFCSYLWFTR